MTDRKKNILIGLFVSGALAIFVAFVLFLKPTIGDGKKTLNVRFQNIAGITIGTRVSFAGKPVGEVTHVIELPDAREQPDTMGKIYPYQLVLKVDSSVEVYSNDEIAIKTTGLMGEKSVAILPKNTLHDQSAYLVTDQIVYANSTDQLENTFNQVAKAASQLGATVNKLDQWFGENQGYLTNAIRSFDGAMGGIEGVLGMIDSEKLVPAVKQSVDLLTENLHLVKTGLDDDKLLHKFANLADNLDQTANYLNSDGAAALRNVNQITRDVASGTGTVGRLIVGDDFYLRLASLMNKGETLMNDINHYGVLFQYNKQWQKSRTKRANILKALDTPQEFRNYFEGEVDSMTTSLGRLSELMDRADVTERSTILQSDAFKRNFASLMRQVQGLTDSLKLYNEGLIAESEQLGQQE